MANTPIITMISDFGIRSHYVAAMKAIIYRIIPEVNIVDVTHNITPYNIYEAAFLLRNIYFYFPVKTVHLVVVDPEVGGDRKPIVVTTPQHFFVGPDNGVFSYIYEDCKDTGFSVYHLVESHYFRTQISPTFHGRDIFAPAAAWLARGTNAEEVGPKLENFTRLNLPQPIVQGNVVTCTIMHIDSFGNAITNLSKEIYTTLSQKLGTNKISVKIGNQIINEISPSYFALTEKKIGVVFGSTDNLEIAVYKKAAFRELGLNLFAQIQVVFG